ncbi:MAG: DUF4124 domain-containing protein [Pseudomonadales bacterium]
MKNYSIKNNNLRYSVWIPALFFTALGASAVSSAKIYKTVDAAGNVTYSDVAPTKREREAELEVEELNTFTSPEPAPTELPTVVLNNPDNDEDQEQDPVPDRYDTVAMASPGDDEAIRSNAGNITLTASIAPELHTLHNVRFFIDGSPVGTGKSLSFSLTNVDRGTHTAKVAVVDDSGAVISQSSSVSFHVLRVFRPPKPRG